MKLTGKDGVLRIFDSSLNLHGASPRADATPDIVKWDGAAAYTNITTDVDTDDGNFASAFLTDNNDGAFIGSDKSFAMIDYLLDAGANYAAASGALLAYYFDGTDFSNAVVVSDGTASGGNCFAQDGQISFSPPEGWALGANGVNAALDADKYYIKLMTTTSPTTDPDADVLCPVDAQFFEVVFANMDFTGPIGRPLPEEILVMNRGKASSDMHYVKGPDSPLYEPLPISFGLGLDDTINKNDIQPALACGNPGSTYWTAAGTTAKGTTQNDGSNANPAFADANKKAVNIQILFGTMGYGWAYYEVYFPEDQATFAESESDVPLSVNGGCYGAIELIHGFGIRH